VIYIVFDQPGSTSKVQNRKVQNRNS
jgi:hypothetical protein